MRTKEGVERRGRRESCGKKGVQRRGGCVNKRRCRKKEEDG